MKINMLNASCGEVKKEVLQLVLVLLLLIGSNACYAQVKAVPATPIDIDTYNLKLPFDVSFLMQKKFTTDTEVEYVGLFELDGHGNKRIMNKTEYEVFLEKMPIAFNYNKIKITYDAKIKSIKKSNPRASTVEAEQIARKELIKSFPKYKEAIDEIRKQFPIEQTTVSSEIAERKYDKTTKVLTINFPPLKSNTAYQFVIVTNPAKSGYGDLYKLSLIKDEEGYNKIYDKEPFNQIIPIDYTVFKTDFKDKFDEFRQNSDEIVELVKVEKCNPITYSLFSNFAAELLQCEECKNKYGFTFEKDSIAEVMNVVENLSTAKLNDKVLCGMLPLNASVETKEAGKEDYPARIANVISSYKSINQLYKQVQVVALMKPGTQFDVLLGRLREVRECLNGEKAAYDGINKNLEKLYEEVRGNVKLSALIYRLGFFEGNSYVYSFDSRNSFAITPDFGFLYYGPKLNNSFSPYLGFHINFKYVDKDIPWKKYPNKQLLHYLSFHTGVLLVSLKEANKTDDFFNSKSIFTGMGLRVNSVMRITGGAVWFNRVDPNPLIDKKHISATPYVALSLDVAVQSLLNGVNKFFL